MAIEQDIVIAASPNADKKIRLLNSSSQYRWCCPVFPWKKSFVPFVLLSFKYLFAFRFGVFVFSCSSFECDTTDFTIDKTKPQWYHYFLCGYKGVVEQTGDTMGEICVCLFLKFSNGAPGNLALCHLLCGF